MLKSEIGIFKSFFCCQGLSAHDRRALAQFSEVLEWRNKRDFTFQTKKRVCTSTTPNRRACRLDRNGKKNTELDQDCAEIGSEWTDMDRSGFRGQTHKRFAAACRIILRCHSMLASFRVRLLLRDEGHSKSVTSICLTARLRHSGRKSVFRRDLLGSDTPVVFEPEVRLRIPHPRFPASELDEWRNLLPVLEVGYGVSRRRLVL